MGRRTTSETCHARSESERRQLVAAKLGELGISVEKIPSCDIDDEAVLFKKSRCKDWIVYYPPSRSRSVSRFQVLQLRASDLVRYILRGIF